jgi:hypothetical protein
MDEHTFDYGDLTDELRFRETEWLRCHVEDLVREQRRLHVEELAARLVLDERGAQVFETGVSDRTARDNLETARALESRPALAQAAYNGALSSEQLKPAVELSDASTDAEWAVRAPNTAPADLNRMARRQRDVTRDQAAARREARDFAMWWRPDAGMLAFRGQVPDVDGALVESVFNHMIERMRPTKGEPWDTYAHRGADTLVELCRNYADVEPTGTHRPHLVVEVPLQGPAEVAGIPISEATLEALRANAVIEPIVVDERGPISVGRSRPALSLKIRRAVLLRDRHCRWPGCTRTTGLEVHHITPRSWGGTDDIANLAAACIGGSTDHHHKLAPQGNWMLVGNPNQPDGLRLISTDEYVSVEARAGPAA